MAPPSRRWTCARKTTRRSPPNSRRKPSAAPRKRPRRRRGRAQGRRRGGPRRRRGCAPAEAEDERRRRQAQARRPASRRALPSPLRTSRSAGGHVRPWRGGLRPVARPRHPGRPDLRRALGGPPPRRDHDRGRHDRDPPRRRRRGRQRRLTTAIAWRRAQDALACDARCAVGARQRPADALGRRTTGTQLRPRGDRGCLRRDHARRRRRRSAPATAHRKLDVEDEATGAAARPYFDGARLVRRAPRVMRCARVPRRRRARSTRSRRSRSRTRARCAASGTAPARGAARDRRQEPVRWPGAACARSSSPGMGFALARGRARTRSRSTQLYVTPAARGRGHRPGADRRRARAPAGASVAWIVADDEGLARALYERLGFATVWRFYGFTRKPAELDPAAAGEVGRGAGVAAERGVGDDARVPRERLVRRDLDREVRAPARALVVEVDELVEREAPAEAPAQLAAGSRGSRARASAPARGRRRRAAAGPLPTARVPSRTKTRGSRIESGYFEALRRCRRARRP